MKRKAVWGVGVVVVAVILTWVFGGSELCGLSFESRNLRVIGVERGGQWRGEFIARNGGSARLVLQVGLKSCACIGAEIKNATLEPGESTVIATDAVMPIDGSLRGDLLIYARREGSEERQSVHLSFEGVADMLRGITVFPKEIVVPKSEWCDGFAREVVVMYYDPRGGEPPRLQVSPSFVLSVGDQRWRRMGAGKFQQKMELQVTPVDDMTIIIMVGGGGQSDAAPTVEVKCASR